MKPAVVTSLIALCAGCGSSAHPGFSPDAGGDDAGSSVTFGTGDAAGAQGLGATIEQGQVAVKLVTLSCAGDCATLQAVGTGGDPPYVYAWEDGSTNPVRQVCPTSDTAYSVKVTDSGGSGENLRPRQTAEASVTADVRECRDAGPGDAGPRDAAPAMPPTDACVGEFANPSLEGTPRASSAEAWNASGWTQCSCACPAMGAYPTYLANQSSSTLGQSYPAPSAGQTYAVIQIEGVPAGGLYLGFSQQLCTPAAAGTSFRFDAMVLDPSPLGTEVGIDVSGGQAVCEQALSLLDVALTTSWKTYCVTVAQDTPAITFNSAVNNPAATALILVDNLAATPSCP